MTGSRWIVCLAVLLPMIGFAGCADDAPPAPSQAATPGADTYIIGPGDRLSVFVYDSPQLSAEVPVPLMRPPPASVTLPTESTLWLAPRSNSAVEPSTVTLLVNIGNVYHEQGDEAHAEEDHEQPEPHAEIVIGDVFDRAHPGPGHPCSRDYALPCINGCAAAIALTML